jgi:hypothetical protein
MPGRQVTSSGCFADRELPVGTLHLSSRSANWLTRHDINSVGDLLQRADSDSSLSFITYPKARPEVAACLALLSNSVGPDRSVDWVGYAERHGAEILPGTKGDISFDLFARGFVSVIKTAVALRYGPAYQAIVENFIGEPSVSLPPLSGLARKRGCSRQAVSKFKDRLITTLQDAVFRDAAN